MIDLVASDQQRKFGRDKWDTLPQFCHQCDFLFACNGECPKNRFIETPDGKPGLNYLCAGFKAFFKHSDPAMKVMAGLIRRGRLAEEVMTVSGSEGEAPGERVSVDQGRNDPCSCGSGLKFKKCHGK